MKRSRVSRLGNTLDALYDGFDFNLHRTHDPIELASRYRGREDREAAAFIAALFAYGRVDLFMTVLERRVFGVMGASPYAFILGFDGERDAKRFADFRYRFNTGDDVVLLLRAMQRILKTYGSLERLFMEHYRNDGNVREALDGFVRALLDAAGTGRAMNGFSHLLPSPARGGACKRLNMFLRWMVRDRDVDLGLWRGIPKNRLVIPLDTHIGRIAQCLGLTNRKSGDWKTAEEITASLRLIDPDDPLRYDFVLSHQGISGSCRADRSRCGGCGLLVTE